MKKALIISVLVNVLLVLFCAYLFYKKHKTPAPEIQEIKLEKKYPDYYYIKKSIFAIMPKDSNGIFFVGNSITDYCDWYELFKKKNIKNRGIGGDVINGVIDRLDAITEAHPKKIFLEIGINDLGKKRSVTQILTDYDKLLSLIHEKIPATAVYIHSVFPTDNRVYLKITDILAINEGLKKLAIKQQVTYINLFDLLKSKENKLDTSYTFDGIHINGKGYLIWKKAIQNYIED
jgi:lysophospholipase L1-like esterase